MNKLSLLLLICLSLVGVTTAFSQVPTPLYAGERYGTNLRTIDTTTWAVVSTVTLTSDYGYVGGCYGLALNPLTDDMYILYQSSAGAFGRRLGIVDPMTGSISDIGNAGNRTDIAFTNDGSLYGSGGSYSGTDLYEIDPVTGASSIAYYSASAYWGASITHDPFTDDLIRSDVNSVFRINPVGFSETYISYSPDETQAMVVLTPTKAAVVHYGSRYELDLVSGVQSYMGYLGFNCHALSFGQVPCHELDITVSATELCAGEAFTLTATSVTGGTISWDGGITNGVPFVPAGPGTYTYHVSSDSEEDCPADPVIIKSIGLPTVIAGAGDLVFCENQSITLSSGGDAHLYEWNGGAPLNLMPGIGTYTFTLTGYYTEGGCLGENEDEVTVSVVGLPTITATASDSPICINNSVTLNGAGGDTYTWDHGVMNGVSFIPGELGTTTYTVIGKDENGCSNSASVDVEVVPGVTITGGASDEIVGGDGSINITVSGGAPAYTFDWDNDGTGDFDDTEDLSDLTAGEYTVVVQSEAGCSATYTFRVDSQLGVDEINGLQVDVYPNPTTENVNIVLVGAFEFEILTISGEILLTGTANDKKVVSLKDYADGIYFVNVKSNDNTATFKVVKK